MRPRVQITEGADTIGLYLATDPVVREPDAGVPPVHPERPPPRKLGRAAVAVVAAVTAGCSLPWHDFSKDAQYKLGAWPVDPAVARKSTFEITAIDGSAHGSAWVVDEHHLVTAAQLCEKSRDWHIAVSRVVWVVALDERLCLLQSFDDMGPGIVLASYTPGLGSAFHAIEGDATTSRTVRGQGRLTGPGNPDLGSPVITKAHNAYQCAAGALTCNGRFYVSGVVGVIIGPRWKVVGVSRIKAFLRRNGVHWRIEPGGLGDPTGGGEGSEGEDA